MSNKWASNPEPLTSLNLEASALPCKDKTGERLELSALERMSVEERMTVRTVPRTNTPGRLEMMELERGARSVRPPADRPPDASAPAGSVEIVPWSVLFVLR